VCGSGCLGSTEHSTGKRDRLWLSSQRAGDQHWYGINPGGKSRCCSDCAGGTRGSTDSVKCPELCRIGGVDNGSWESAGT
jgi:hypothetical protein